MLFFFTFIFTVTVIFFNYHITTPIVFFYQRTSNDYLFYYILQFIFHFIIITVLGNSF
jgi:hypothetical protein